MFFQSFAGTLLALGVMGGIVGMAAPYLLSWMMRRTVLPPLKGKSGQNLMMQMLTMFRLFDAETVMATMRRAQTGKAFRRPFGTGKSFLGMEQLMFAPAQLGVFPREEKEVDTSVVLGPAARRPLKLKIPIMVAGMAYGLSLSKAVKLAAAKATKELGTATNSGESGFFKDEREAAGLYIVQYNRGGWNNRPEELRQVDMVEIQFGQGADAAVSESTKYDQLPPEVHQHLHLKPGQDAVIHSRFPNVQSVSDLKRLVQELREMTEGIPIAVKIAAGNIERDLDAIVAAGADVVVIDGAQGSTGGGYGITIHDFGIPTAYAIPRAHHFLMQKGVRDRISLVASGGLRDAGDFLKAMALGADAVYVGAAALVAMMQDQLLEVMPMAAPTELFLEKGRLKDRFDPEKGAAYLANYLKASTQEMVIGARALGKARLENVTSDDLYALTREVAEITGTRLAYPSLIRPLGPGMEAQFASVADWRRHQGDRTDPEGSPVEKIDGQNEHYVSVGAAVPLTNGSTKDGSPRSD